MGLFVFGATVIVTALVLTALWVKETLAWAHAEGARHAAGKSTGPTPRFPQNISGQPTTWEVFYAHVLARQAHGGLEPGRFGREIRRCADLGRVPGVSLRARLKSRLHGWVVGVYGFVWGGSQFFTGRLSDRIGRQKRSCGHVDLQVLASR